MSDVFTGQWVTRPGGVRVPVIVDEPKRKQSCRVCGTYARTGLCRPCKESTRSRVHGSHAGFNQHTRRNELPCEACSIAEKAYQRGRYRRGQLSDVDRAWCEKNAVKWSWSVDTRTNRHASVANTSKT